MVSDSFSWTNPTASTKSNSCFLGHIPVPIYRGKTVSIVRIRPRVGFCTARNLVQQETWTEKMGLEAGIS